MCVCVCVYVCLGACGNVLIMWFMVMVHFFFLFVSYCLVADTTAIMLDMIEAISGRDDRTDLINSFQSVSYACQLRSCIVRECVGVCARVLGERGGERKR